MTSSQNADPDMNDFNNSLTDLGGDWTNEFEGTGDAQDFLKEREREGGFGIIRSGEEYSYEEVELQATVQKELTKLHDYSFRSETSIEPVGDLSSDGNRTESALRQKKAKIEQPGWVLNVHNNWSQTGVTWKKPMEDRSPFKSETGKVNALNSDRVNFCESVPDANYFSFDDSAWRMQ